MNASPAEQKRSANAHRGNSAQQAQRRQAALHQLAARSRSRSGSNPSSRTVSQQPSRADLEVPYTLDHLQIESALDQDAAAARLAGEYLAAVQSAASLHSAAASSASSWPQQCDLPAKGGSETKWGHRKIGNEPEGMGVMGRDWEGVLRRGVELAQGPSTDQFLEVVDLYPDQRAEQVRMLRMLHGPIPCSCVYRSHLRA